MIEKDQITVEYYVTKNSAELEKVHPFRPVSSQEWLNKQTRLHNSKRSSQEKSEFRFMYRQGTYLSEEEE